MTRIRFAASRVKNTRILRDIDTATNPGVASASPNESKVKRMIRGCTIHSRIHVNEGLRRADSIGHYLFQRVAFCRKTKLIYNQQPFDR